MKVSATFQNGMCKVVLVTEDEWEQKLLSAVAKGGRLEANVDYDKANRFSTDQRDVVSVTLLPARVACPPTQTVEVVQ